jgi:hypothetical protein
MNYYLYKQTCGKYCELYSGPCSTYDDSFFSEGASESKISRELFQFILKLFDGELRVCPTSRGFKTRVFIFQIDE